MTQDQSTADAFATSWNNLPPGTVYTTEQVEDWFAPLLPEDFRGKRVVELGCGNGSLLVHVVSWQPRYLEGVDLGDSIASATRNLQSIASEGWSLKKADLVTYEADQPFDIAYSIGVLHHLKEPYSGFKSVLRNTRPSGRFHCWVYAHEGNALIRWLLEPIRKVACKLPWWLTKYLIATPLVVPYFVYAKTVRAFLSHSRFDFLPLHAYSLWIAQRDFFFFRHVAFDQLVTPQTSYIRRVELEQWLRDDQIDPSSIYIVMRNGNSWKFGGRRA